MPAGRPKHSPILREAEGGYRKDPQRRPESFINGAEGLPEPSDLVAGDELAMKIWTEACAALKSIGLLTKTDKFLIEAYTMNYREFIVLMRYVHKNGHDTTGQNGERKTDPAVISMHKISDRHIKLMNELGLTPQGRMRLAGSTGKPENGDVRSLLERLGNGSSSAN